MNIASIDIGSNTVLLLIAKVDVPSGDIFPLINNYEAPRLGRGLKPGGIISDEAVLKLLKVLCEYSSKIKELK